MEIKKNEKKNIQEDPLNIMQDVMGLMFWGDPLYKKKKDEK